MPTDRFLEKQLTQYENLPLGRLKRTETEKNGKCHVSIERLSAKTRPLIEVTDVYPSPGSRNIKRPKGMV